VQTSIPHTDMPLFCRIAETSCRGTSTRSRRAGVPCGLAFAVALAISGVLPSSAHAQQATEHKLIAAYLYNFGLYFTWPDAVFPAPDEPFVIGVFGDDPVANALARELDAVARKKRIRGRRIEIRRFRDWDKYRPCHILFLPSVDRSENLTAAVKHTGRTPALVVGGTAGSAKRGADVSFYHDVDGTIGFQINVDTVAARGLGVAAKLLKLAEVVRGVPRPEAGG